MTKSLRHYEETSSIPTSPEELFAYVDDHRRFSSHMNQSSWMMGGGSMNTQTDDKKFQEVGSHIKMEGTVFGITLFLDEVVTQYEPPSRKEWQTVGDLRLIVIDHYKLGFKIVPDNSNSKFRVYIDYDLPRSVSGRLLGYLLGGMYAKWCVRQMLKGASDYFATPSHYKNNTERGDTHGS